jgi:hypothetical protein
MRTLTILLASLCLASFQMHTGEHLSPSSAKKYPVKLHQEPSNATSFYCGCGIISNERGRGHTARSVLWLRASKEIGKEGQRQSTSHPDQMGARYACLLVRQSIAMLAGRRPQCMQEGQTISPDEGRHAQSTTRNRRNTCQYYLLTFYVSPMNNCFLRISPEPG